MSRLRNAVAALLVVGGGSAVWASDRDGFIIGFFFVVYGGIAAFLAAIATGRPRSKPAPDGGPSARFGGEVKDPWVEIDAIRRFPGDGILDLQNHPLPGTDGRR